VRRLPGVLFPAMVALAVAAACSGYETSPVSPTSTALLATPLGQGKTSLCHQTEGTNAFVLISVADPSLETHLAHGDLSPGNPVPGMPGFVFDGACMPLADDAAVFVGTFVGTDGVSGTIELSVQAIAVLASPTHSTSSTTNAISPASIEPVSGILRFVGGGSVLLVGTWDDSTGLVAVSGGGYTFTGTLTLVPLTLSGTFTGPSSGIFTTLPSAGGAEVTTYCGTFDGDGVGAWMMQISSDGEASAVGHNELNNEDFAGTGQLSGTSLTITGTFNWNGSATGTVANDQASGTWFVVGEGSGTWTGSTAGCQ